VTVVGNAAGTGTLSEADGATNSLSTPITTESEGSVEGETLHRLGNQRLRHRDRPREVTVGGQSTSATATLHASPMN
jgi:hypothetical protein